MNNAAYIFLHLHSDGSAVLFQQKIYKNKTACITYDRPLEAIADLMEMHYEGLVTMPELMIGATPFFCCRPIENELPYEDQKGGVR
jgi:hypothetical protein